jgi:hypothetical protein
MKTSLQIGSVGAGTDRDFAAKAIIAGVLLTNSDIRDAELNRARHALAYLQRKLGNDAMRDLLTDDTIEMTARVRGWVQTSGGTWQHGSVELIVPEPSAKIFYQWYASAISNDWELDLRAGHPEHFINHPQADTIEVVENIGETELPWRIFYRTLPEDANFPMDWDADYPIHFGAEIVDSDGLRIGFSMRQLCDRTDGLHLKLTTHLPSAAPRELVQRHLYHFAIEYRNWMWAACRSQAIDSSD